MVRRTAGMAGKTLIIAIALIFMSAFLAMFLMGTLEQFFAFFGFVTSETDIWDIFIPLLVVIVGPVLIVIIAAMFGAGTTHKTGLKFGG